jgi:hypothetical protein
VQTVYRILADALSTTHLTLMVFVVFGQLLILIGIACGWRWIRNPWFRWTHMTAILVVAVEAVLGINCPLTDWEDDLRYWGGGITSDKSFTARIVHKFLFPNVSGEVLFACYLGFAGVVLLSFWLAPPWHPAPRGQVLLRLGCPGRNGQAGRGKGLALAEIPLERPERGVDTRTVVCPVCERQVGIEVKSRKHFWKRAGLLALAGAALVCVGYSLGYLEAALWGGRVIHRASHNTITVIGLILMILAPSGLLIRRALVRDEPTRPPETAGQRHRLFV